MNEPKISLIIVNWNKKNDLLECLESVQKLNYSNFNTIVVDNGSIDDSLEMIKQNFSKVFLIKNKKNLGFAKGNNQGIELALRKGADYVFLLNNDAVIEKNCLRELVKVVESNKKYGVLGPKIYYFSVPNRIQSVGEIFIRSLGLTFHRERKKFDKGQFNSITEVDFISGCAMLLKTEAIKKVGLFDELFFSYLEDLDLCYRLKKKGYKTIVVPTAKVWHKESLSTKGTTFKLFFKTRNSIIFMRKNIHHLKRPIFLFGFFFHFFTN